MMKKILIVSIIFLILISGCVMNTQIIDNDENDDIENNTQIIEPEFEIKGNIVVSSVGDEK